MLKDYENVLKFFRRLDGYALKMYHSHLIDLDKGDYNSILDWLYANSEFSSVYSELKESWGAISEKERADRELTIIEYSKGFIKDVNFSATVDEMSDNDMMCFLNCIMSYQVGDFLILRYDEIRIFNNLLVVGNTYNMYGQLLRECRSFVLDIRNFEVVSLPFYKFMNMNEAEDYTYEAVMQRLKCAKVVEYTDKLDGSFIQITKLKKKYDFYGYEDLLTSSKNIRDTLIVTGARKWYEGHVNYKEMVRSYPGFTFMFEWISMDDTHIVYYTKEQVGLYLIGARNKSTGELLNYEQIKEIANKFNVMSTKMYDLTFESMVDTLSKFKAAEKEGYVVNIDGFLLKMKCTDYLEMVCLLKENGHGNAVLRAISNNSIDELMSMLPKEYHERVKEVAEQAYAYISMVSGKVNECVDYLCQIDIARGDVEKWCKRLPYFMQGVVKNLYFCRINHKESKQVLDYLRTNNTQLSGNYINMEELKRRVKIINNFDLEDINVHRG